MHLVIRIPSLLKCIAAPLALYAASAYFVGGITDAYNGLVLPGFAPRAALFEALGVFCCLLLGATAYLICMTRSLSRRDRLACLTLYGFVLIGSCFWMLLTFRFRLLLFGAIWAVLLLPVAALCGALFYRIRRAAGLVMAPAVLWQAFLAVFGFSLSALN